MDLYFFLQADGFEPAITVSSFPPTSELNEAIETVYISVAYPQEDKWIIFTQSQLKQYGCLTISGSDLKLPPEKVASSLLFLSSEKMDGEYQELPNVTGFSSTPSWRGNLKILGNGTSTSYQGEMPYGMTKIKGGSIVSLVPFIQSGASVKNYLLFSSFTSNPVSQTGSISFRSVKSKKVLATFELVSNKVNCIDLSEVKLSTEQLLLTTKGIMGIPVFFSVDESENTMSLEHTMTPSEYSIYGEESVRRSIMKDMKSYWSQKK